MLFRKPCPALIATLVLLTALGPAALAQTPKVACAALLERSTHLPQRSYAARQLWERYVAMVLREGEAQRVRFLGMPKPAATERIVTVLPEGIVLEYETGRARSGGGVYNAQEHEAHRERLLQLEAALDAGVATDMQTRNIDDLTGLRRFLAAPVPDPVATDGEVPRTVEPTPPAPSRWRWLERWIDPLRYAAIAALVGIGGIASQFRYPSESERTQVLAAAVQDINGRPSAHPPIDRTALEDSLKTPQAGEFWTPSTVPARVTEADLKQLRERLSQLNPWALGVLVFCGFAVFGLLESRNNPGFLGGPWPLLPRLIFRQRWNPAFDFAIPHTNANRNVPKDTPLDPSLALPQIERLFAALANDPGARAQTEPFRYRHVAITLPTGESVDLLIESHREYGQLHWSGAFLWWMGTADFWPPGRNRRTVQAAALAAGGTADQHQVSQVLLRGQTALFNKIDRATLPTEAPYPAIRALFRRASEGNLSLVDATAFSVLAEEAPLANLSELEAFLAARGL